MVCGDRRACRRRSYAAEVDLFAPQRADRYAPVVATPAPRTLHQIAEVRRAKIADLAARNLTPQAIGKRLGLTGEQVTRDLTAIRAQQEVTV